METGNTRRAELFILRINFNKHRPAPFWESNFLFKRPNFSSENDAVSVGIDCRQRRALADTRKEREPEIRARSHYPK